MPHNATFVAILLFSAHRKPVETGKSDTRCIRGSRITLSDYFFTKIDLNHGFNQSTHPPVAPLSRVSRALGMTRNVTQCHTMPHYVPFSGILSLSVRSRFSLIILPTASIRGWLNDLVRPSLRHAGARFPVLTITVLFR